MRNTLESRFTTGAMLAACISPSIPVQGSPAFRREIRSVYRVAGDHLGRNYRFDEAVVQTRRAIALDPGSTRASIAITSVAGRENAECAMR